MAPSRRRAPLRALPALIVASVGLMVAGCATGPPSVILDREHLVALLKSRNIYPGDVILPYGLTEEMRAFAHQTASTDLPPLTRLERLRERLLNDLDVHYAWGYTGTAADVFQRREANCLAYTNLFVGLAREVRVPVYFLAVDNIERYRKEGDLVVVSDHVAVGYGDNVANLTIFDFADQEPVKDPRFVRRISDLTAISMFYSNRGAEALKLGLNEAAASWLRGALLIDPELPNAWVNLGVALRRQGKTAEAEEAYHKALQLDPRVYSAYNNLVTLLRAEGREQEALAFERQLDRSPSNNPFTYLSLGDISLSAGRATEAERYYRRAVGLGRDNAEVFAALGQLAAAKGDGRLARRMLKKAQELDAAMPRVQRLAELVAALDNKS